MTNYESLLSRSGAGRLRPAFAAILAVGAAAVWQITIAADDLRWYAGLLKPTFSPSPWLAALGCGTLAILLASAFYRVLRSPDYLPDRFAAIRLFLIGLLLDALWTWLFFAGRHPTVALAVAAALAVVAASSAWHFASIDRRAGLLALPWAFAAAFAFLLDLSIALRNG